MGMDKHCVNEISFTNNVCFFLNLPVNNELAFLTPCDQAFNTPFLGGKNIELAKFCFKNKRF